MEIEDNGLPFFDVLVKHDDNNKVRYAVYRKKTHPDRYLQATSHHHPQGRNSLQTHYKEDQRKLVITGILHFVSNKFRTTENN